MMKLMSNAASHKHSTNTIKQTELKKALGKAKTVQETLEAFKDLESNSQESELGPACFVVAKKLYTQGFHDIEKVVSFAKRAVAIFTDTKAPSLLIGVICQWLGTVCHDNAMYDDCLLYLNNASMFMWSELELKKECCDDLNDVMELLLEVEEMLCHVTKVLGMNEAVVVHLKKILEIKEKMMDEGCVELGHVNKEVYEACFIAVDIEGALPYCVKALEIYKRYYGAESVEIGKVTMHLGLVYSKLGELKKAYEQNQIAVGVFKKVAPHSADMIAAEADSANVLIDLGRYKEAVVVLKRLITHTDVTKQEKINLLISLAKALCFLKKFADAKKYLKAVQKIFEKKDVHPKLVAVGFADISIYYEEMKDFETAIYLLKKALAVPELPRKLIPGYTSRIFSLLCLSRKEKEGIQYMESFVENLKKSFGPKHSQVGRGYAQLGDAYSKLGQKELAVKSMENAKEILDVSLGPRHLTSLRISHDLSVTLAGLQRYNQALEIEDKVAQGLKGLPPSELGFIHEVSKHLSEMKERVAESHTDDSPQSKDEGGLSAKISKCGISEDGTST